MRRPNIFISHQWKYNNQYYSLKRKFIELNWEHFDYSVPKHDPGDWYKINKIKNRIK